MLLSLGYLTLETLNISLETFRSLYLFVIQLVDVARHTAMRLGNNSLVDLNQVIFGKGAPDTE